MYAAVGGFEDKFHGKSFGRLKRHDLSRDYIYQVNGRARGQVTSRQNPRKMMT